MAVAASADRSPLASIATKVSIAVAVFGVVGGLLTFTFKASAFVDQQGVQETRIEKLEKKSAGYDALDKAQGQQLEILKRIEQQVDRIDSRLEALDSEMGRTRENTAALCAKQNVRCR